MYESTAKLCSVTYTQDTALNQIPAYTDRDVFVKPRSVSRADFYAAAQSGLKPSVVLVLSNYADYQGEKVVLFQGKEYTVIRVYQRPEKDAVELTLEERTENGC